MVKKDYQLHKQISLKTIQFIINNKQSYLLSLNPTTNIPDLKQKDNHFHTLGILIPSFYILNDFISSIDEEILEEQSEFLNWVSNNISNSEKLAINNIALSFIHEIDLKKIFQEVNDYQTMNINSNEFISEYLNFMLFVLRLNTLETEIGISDKQITELIAKQINHNQEFIHDWLTLSFERMLHKYH